MKDKTSGFVVDADVARSAGETEHPVSKSSRLLLDSILANGAVIILCPKLGAEWREHKSVYATRWLGSMVARKRVRRITPEEVVLSNIENVLQEREIDIAIKDAHIIDAAIESQALIASNDTVARRVFQGAAPHFHALRGLVWIVPREHVAIFDQVFDTRGVMPLECCF